MSLTVAPINGTPFIGGNAPGDLQVDSSGLQRLVKHNIGAGSDPTTGDDSGDGYAVGSRWWTTAGKLFFCDDASVGAAVWTQVNPAGGGGLSAADIDTLAELNAIVADATLIDTGDSRLSDARTPTSHASSHASGGGDAIKLDDLAAPDDNTDLNASTSNHGLLPKLGGGTTNFLRADGTWNAPASGGGGTVQAGAGNLGIRATDQGSVAGNARGNFSVELQTRRNYSSQVASGAYSTVAGGRSNTASATGCVVVGGRSNAGTANYSSTVGGFFNTASGIWSTVCGGKYNTAASNASTVCGGISNTASGSYSWVGTGQSNTASGSHSHASGRRSKATHQGSWVLSDSTDADVNSSTTDEMTLRFANGVRILGRFGLNLTAIGTRSHIADPSGGATQDAEARTAIKSILVTLESFGFHATS